MRFTRSKGFTLVELLVVIGIVGILLAITLVAINPARQFQQANDAKRSADVNAVLNAITQLKVDNRGTLPAAAEVGTAAAYFSSGLTACSSFMSLCQYLTGAVGGVSYIAQLPFDAKAGLGGGWTSCTNFSTGYQISESAAGRVTVDAPGVETTSPATTISVTR